jgi:hypothetical protein
MELMENIKCWRKSWRAESCLPAGFWATESIDFVGRVLLIALMLINTSRLMRAMLQSEMNIK